MAKVELKDAYFMLPNWEEDRAFLKFSFKDCTYQLKSLPFGLACATWVFNKTLNPVTAQLVGRLTQARTESSQWEDQSRHTIPARRHNQEVQQTSACAEAGPGSFRPALLEAVNALHRGARITAMPLERQDHRDGETVTSGRVRRLHSRLGSDVRRRRPVFSRGESVAHQLPVRDKRRRSLAVLLRLDNTSAVSYVNRLGETVSPSLNSIVRDLWLWCMNRDIILTPTRCPEHDSRRGISDNEGSLRLEAGSRGIPPIPRCLRPG